MILAPFQRWKNLINVKALHSIISVLDVAYKVVGVTPEKKDVFNCFTECPYDKLKVVIIGLDPYPQQGVATGLAFANKEGTKELSPSLSVIRDALFNPHNPSIWPTGENVEELKNNFDITLKHWANQGVLLLNSALTAKIGFSELHIDLWRPFMVTLLTELSLRNPGIVYILYGTVAKNLAVYINHANNCVLKENHPAQFARLSQEMDDEMFINTNNYLKEHYGETIDWYGIRKYKN